MTAVVVVVVEVAMGGEGGLWATRAGADCICFEQTWLRPTMQVGVLDSIYGSLASMRDAL